MRTIKAGMGLTAAMAVLLAVGCGSGSKVSTAAAPTNPTTAPAKAVGPTGPGETLPGSTPTTAAPTPATTAPPTTAAPATTAPPPAPSAVTKPVAGPAGTPTIGNFCTLKAGMTKAQVQTVMGRPYFIGSADDTYKLTDNGVLLQVQFTNGIISNAVTTSAGAPPAASLCG